MNRSQLQTVSLLSGCLLFIGATRAQLAVQNNLTPNELVNSILVGQGVTVSNVTFNGQPANTIHDQIGSFAGTSNLGLANGVVLATGQVPEVVGPNMNTSLTVPPAFPVNTPDPDLAFIETMQHCVAVLEFDFIPTGDSISFRFVFGSEEYPEYVCSQFNDVFGFFLSGPGINGPFTNNAVNLGVLPGTQVPVAINTVNSGTPGVLGGGAYVCAASDPDWQSNSIYYVNNPEPNPFNPTTTVELDGFTVPIRARAAVQCGQVYHIKIAIAHAGDSSLDSAVFIEGGSFSSSGSLSVSVATPLNDGTLTEGCGEAIVTVERPSTEGDADIQLTAAPASRRTTLPVALLK
ncbi:MAG: choice-of-anchor L domain-containing protein [Flavobacteriales bacterium]|nr:choice-of-anchor L domain-containing protein [Flavobacteriales bacterium]